MATVDLSPKSVKEVAKAVADLLNPQIAASGAIDLSILELNHETGQVRYAAYPQTLFLDPHVEGYAGLSENAKITIGHNCGSTREQTIGTLPPGAMLKPDPDPALRVGTDPSQWFGFVARCFPCFADSSQPQGYRAGPDALENTLALRFPSTETAIRKALKG